MVVQNVADLMKILQSCGIDDWSISPEKELGD